MSRKSVRTPINATETLSVDAARLLTVLAQPGAYGWISGEAPDARLAVTGSRHGVSVQIATLPPNTAKPLESLGLAGWESAGSSRRRLFLTDAGRARLARKAAEPETEPFRAQHSIVRRRRLAVEGEDGEVAVNVQESPLAWLAARKGRDGRALVDAALLEAGERLRRDLTFAQILPRVTANWSAAATSSDPAYAGLTYSDVVIAARQRVDRALTAVGPDFSGVLTDVCGFLKGLELIESERGWPARSGKIVLCLALNSLARHCGYATRAKGPAASAGLRHWGASDYRPAIGTLAEPLAPET